MKRGNQIVLLAAGGREEAGDNTAGRAQLLLRGSPVAVLRVAPAPTVSDTVTPSVFSTWSCNTVLHYITTIIRD